MNGPPQEKQRGNIPQHPTRVRILAKSKDAVHVETAGRYLAGRGYEVIWMAPGHNEWPADVWPTENWTAIDLPKGKGPLGKLMSHVKLWWLLVTKVRRESGPLYVLESPMTPPVFFAIPFLGGKRIIYHSQDFLELRKFPIRCYVEKVVAKRADVLILNEPGRARCFKSNYGLTKEVVVVPTALPRDWPVRQRSAEDRKRFFGDSITDDDYVILHLGGFAKNRCTRELIESLQYLPKHYKLVFTGSPKGSGSDQQITALAQTLGVLDRVIQLPRLSYDDMFVVVAQSDLGVLLYPDDGVGNFFQSPGRMSEFLASGVPVLCSRFPNMELLDVLYSIGALADPASAKDIALGIQSYFDNRTHTGSDEAERLRHLFRDSLCYELNGEKIVEAVEQCEALTKHPTP